LCSWVGSKAALNMTAKLLSIDLEKKGIAVSVVHTGYLRKQNPDGFFEKGGPDGMHISPLTFKAAKTNISYSRETRRSRPVPQRLDLDLRHEQDRPILVRSRYGRYSLCRASPGQAGPRVGACAAAVVEA
jgi:NAD(P)-dependent dehydrogenase (short-subunit alcohol dehydrogenase family)